MAHNQLSPSIATIPPSLARVYELSNLKPPPFQPKQLWVFGTTAKVYHPPLFVPDNKRSSARLWVTEDGTTIQAMNRDLDDGKPQVWTLPARPANQMVGPFGYDQETLLGVLPLTDGQVLGIDLTGGTIENPQYVWRANVGGPLNRTPVAATDGVYVGGDNSGTARINTVTGDVDWRTASAVDRVVAVTDAHVFTRDRQNNLQMYAKGRVSDPVTKLARPLGQLDTSDFGVVVANTATNRLLLAAENGLIVCIREAGANTLKAKPIAPPPVLADPEKPAEPAPVGERK
jgi:outer membrane protein assembly factor BamB